MKQFVPKPALCAAFLALAGCGPHEVVCRIDGEVDGRSRAAVEKVASAAAVSMVQGKAAAAYALMTRDSAAATQDSSFDRDLRSIVSANGAFALPSLMHIYYLDSAGSGAEFLAPCAATRDRGPVQVSVQPGLEQAHLVYSTRNADGNWELTEWLVREGGTWRVRLFRMSKSEMAGRSAGTLFKMAGDERRRGHVFNAAMLDVGAQAVADRGPSFKTDIAGAIEEDRRQTGMPSELSGSPPFAWAMNGNIYSVGRIEIRGVKTDLGLLFDLPQKDWDGDRAADAANRAFLADFVESHGEYRQVFGYLIARAIKPDRTRAYATVYRTGRGFAPSRFEDGK